ncbi:MAG: GNAT family N-acetyltransferase [Oscillospiraceae bacterium]
MSIIIKELEKNSRKPALELAWRVFLKFEAPDYTEQGIEAFRATLDDDSFLSQLSAVYAAYDESELAGMLAVRKHGTHIALFFVEEKYQGKGIGRALFQRAIADCPADEMTVNSSPYATEIYHHFGFVDEQSEQEVDGIRYTPMRLKKK